MKKKVLSALLTTAMLASMLVGCGSSNEAPAASTDAAPAASTEAKTEAPASTEAAEPAAEEGKVFNIYCWNEEFKSRLTDHYPGYEEVDGTTGKIGDITVKWNITPSDDNAYQNNLDETLLKQADAAADDKIDLFLIEADYALKYVDTDYTMPVKDLGITDADLANQYQYTKDVVTDSNGNLKGVSWQGCPGVLIYNREAAKAVLGTDDPAEVQKSVSDWDTFTATAEKMKAAGYNMVSSVNDTYRVYSNNVSSKWVQDGKIVIDDNLMKWVDDSKKMVDAKETGTFDLWSDDWSKGFYPDGKVFCYFGPAWYYNFSMGNAQDPDKGCPGDWAIIQGPQAYFWGGTWLLAAEGSDNPEMLADVFNAFTANEDICTKLVENESQFTNNTNVNQKFAEDPNYGNAFLGGQNDTAIFVELAKNIKFENKTQYDQLLSEGLPKYMLDYFTGEVTKDEALANFYSFVNDKYPAIVTP